MFDIHCPTCNQRYLATTRRLDSLHNTADGPLACLQCPKGHSVAHFFRTGLTVLRESVAA